jgi:ribonucleoside-diphosphate reductase alpha chain
MQNLEISANASAGRASSPAFLQSAKADASDREAFLQRKEQVMVEINHHAGLIFEDPAHSKIAASKLSSWVSEEVSFQNIRSFSDSVTAGRIHGLINERLDAFVQDNKKILDTAIFNAQDERFEYFGIRTIYDRYLLKNPKSRDVI